LKQLRGSMSNVDQCVVMDHLHSSAYQKTPYSHAPLGSKSGVAGLNGADLVKFRNSSYDANKIVVSAASSLSSNQIESAVDSSFGGVQSVTGMKTYAEVNRPDYTGSFMNIRDDTIHQIQVAIGYETVGYSHKDFLTFEVLKALIGQWNKTDLSGRFSSHALAESLFKLVDSYGVFNKSYHNSGLFGVYVTTNDEEKLDNVVYEVFNNYAKILSNIGPHDVFRAKHTAIANYLNAISTSNGLACEVGKQVSTVGRRMPPAEFIARIKDMKESDIHGLIETYFYDVDPVIVAHGPLSEMPDYAFCRKWTCWSRW